MQDVLVQTLLWLLLTYFTFRYPTIGFDQYITEFIQSKVDIWKSIVLTPSEIASCQSHHAYSTLTCGVFHLWEFLCRTTPNIAQLLELLEHLISAKFIPALTGHDLPSSIECCLLSLQARLGRLNIISFLVSFLGVWCFFAVLP